MATEKDRVTLYIDHAIHRDIKAFAEETNISLSAMTRVVYVFIVSMWNLDKSYRYQVELLRAAYPEGVPEEQREAATKRYMELRDKVFQQSWMYLRGYLTGMGAGGMMQLSEADRAVVLQAAGLLAHGLEASYGVREFLGIAVSAPRSNQGEEAATGADPE